MPSTCLAKDSIVAFDNDVGKMNRVHRFQKIDGEPATTASLKVTWGSIAFVNVSVYSLCLSRILGFREACV